MSVISEGQAKHNSDYFDAPHWLQAGVIFLIASVLYFVSRSPGLDEIDSINFAMGIREFNLWQHQPHPPGYPLYILFGWIGVNVFRLSPDTALHLVSALGGGLFVATWFLIIWLQFNRRLAWWVTGCLAVTPVVWMIATKVLTDTLAAGFLSAEILAALYFCRTRSLSAVLATTIFGAAAAGARPQLILVVFVILGTTLRHARADRRTKILAWVAIVAANLLWLLPMWYTQWQLKPDTSAQSVYPQLVYTFWAQRLHNPSMYLFAGDWSLKYLGLRFAFHILGWFGLGFGFIQSWGTFIAGTFIALVGLTSYLIGRFETTDRQFWRFHLPWALVHIAIIFINLPATQRYYIIIFPLLLTVLLRGFFRLPSPWHRLAIALPGFLLFITIPLAVLNHRDDSPPRRMVNHLLSLYPPSARSHVALILSTRSQRHAQWYGSEFKTFRPIPPADALPELTKDATAVYTDDPKLPLPRGWYRVPLAAFTRSPIIYWKGHFMVLYLIDRHAGSDMTGSTTSQNAKQ